MKKRSKYGQRDSVVFVVYGKRFVAITPYDATVSKGTKDQLLFKIPMQEAIFLEICSICAFQVKFLI